MRVGEFAEGLQNFSSFIDSFLRVCVAVLGCSDGPPQQLEVAVFAEDGGRWEQ